MKSQDDLKKQKVEEKNPKIFGEDNQNKIEGDYQNKIEEKNKNKLEEENRIKLGCENQNKLEDENKDKIEDENQDKIKEENQNKIEDENKMKPEDENQKMSEEENQKILEEENQMKLEEEEQRKLIGNGQINLEEQTKEKLKEENQIKSEEENKIKLENEVQINVEEGQKEEGNKLIVQDKEEEKKEKEDVKDVDYNYYHYIQSLEKDPKIGLNNIGATCYMNATIQCLSRTTELSNYFLNPENISKFTKDKKLTFSYCELISNLWKSPNPETVSYSPYDFKDVISEMNPLFQGIAANDSKDLILFILQQLHRELKLEENGDCGQSSDDANVDQTDRIAVYEDFEKSMKNNVSIISDLFFGRNEIVSDCLNCRQNGNPIVKYNFQIFNFIIFPLKEVSNYKKNKLNLLNNINNENNIEQNNDSVTIYECFEQSSLPAIMTGDNMMFCNNCQQLTATSYTTKIYSAPKILILILNRGKGNEFKIKINFEQIINIGNFVDQKEGPELKYELYGVLTHIGTSDMSGHFIAFCYSIVDKVWYKFNDAFVDQVFDFQKEVHDFGEPYILFYKKME